MRLLAAAFAGNLACRAGRAVFFRFAPFVAPFAARRELGGDRIGDLLNIHAIALGGGFQALAAITGGGAVRRIEQEISISSRLYPLSSRFLSEPLISTAGLVCLPFAGDGECRSARSVRCS